MLNILSFRSGDRQGHLLPSLELAAETLAGKKRQQDAIVGVGKEAITLSFLTDDVYLGNPEGFTDY